MGFGFYSVCLVYAKNQKKKKKHNVHVLICHLGWVLLIWFPDLLGQSFISQIS